MFSEYEMRNVLYHPQTIAEKTTQGCISARRNVNQDRKKGLPETIRSKDTDKNILVYLFNHLFTCFT